MKRTVKLTETKVKARVNLVKAVLIHEVARYRIHHGGCFSFTRNWSIVFLSRKDLYLIRLAGGRNTDQGVLFIFEHLPRRKKTNHGVVLFNEHLQ